MAANTLFVFAHLTEGWAPAGRLTLTQEHDVVASRFAYGTRYIDRPDAFEIDPVSLGLADKARARGAAPVQSLPYLLEAAERVDQGLPLPTTLTDFFGSAPGAGGARPKATVRDDTGLLWLAKFPAVGDTFDVAQAECCTLQLAQRCGLSVPEVRVQDIGGKSVLLIRRFDRYWQAPGTPIDTGTALHHTLPAAGLAEQRLPFVSGLTLVACDEFESRLKGYSDLALAVRSTVHPAHIRADSEELFGRMVFNIFVSNDDDHLRNHGFVRDPRLPGWRLSPLYDVVPRPSVAFERQLHLQVGSQGKLATLDNAMSAYSAFTPQRSTAIAIIRRIWGELRQWRTALEEMGAGNTGLGRLIDQLAPAMRELDDIASPALQAELRK